MGWPDVGPTEPSYPSYNQSWTRPETGGRTLCHECPQHAVTYYSARPGSRFCELFHDLPAYRLNSARAAIRSIACSMAAGGMPVVGDDGEPSGRHLHCGRNLRATGHSRTTGLGSNVSLRRRASHPVLECAIRPATGNAASNCPRSRASASTCLSCDQHFWRDEVVAGQPDPSAINTCTGATLGFRGWTGLDRDRRSPASASPYGFWLSFIIVVARMLSGGDR